MINVKNSGEAYKNGQEQEGDNKKNERTNFFCSNNKLI